MRALSLPVLMGVWMVFAFAGQAPAQERDKEAKAILNKAIKAAGGAEALNKHAAVSVRAQGKVQIMNMDLTMTIEGAAQFPDKFRQTIEFEIMNKKITTIQVYDGKKGWLRVDDKTREIDDEKTLAEFRELAHAQRIIAMHKLDESYGLSLVGDAKVKDKAAVGIRVTAKGRRDVTLYFDKDKHVLLKAEYRALDPNSMQEVTRQELYSGHKAVGGILTPHRVTILHDGERFADLELTEARYLQKHEKGTFAEPKD